ncbi:hypothetical protein BGP_2250 [Beggiatoa sp. PS]|nr:hypothetical protein BGP_2250 [Beggiatoa sp. PS]
MMNTIQMVNSNLTKLPPVLQTEVFDFTEYLIFKHQRQSTVETSDNELLLSLNLAMRGMEDEEIAFYTLEDLREKF